MGIKKDYMQTMRLSGSEWKDVQFFLKANPFFDSFAALARTAIAEFIRHRQTIETYPVPKTSLKARPYFLWDYNLTEEDVHLILAYRDLTKKKWLIARILEHARFKDVWNYLSLKEIMTAFPHIRMSPKKKEAWQYAIDLWNKK